MSVAYGGGKLQLAELATQVGSRTPGAAEVKTQLTAATLSTSAALGAGAVPVQARETNAGRSAAAKPPLTADTYELVNALASAKHAFSAERMR